MPSGSRSLTRMQWDRSALETSSRYASAFLRRSSEQAVNLTVPTARPLWRRHRDQHPITITSHLPLGMARIADLIARKSPKLLAQAGQVLNQIVSEALCDEPQKKLMPALLGLGAAFVAGVAATGPSLQNRRRGQSPTGMRQKARFRRKTACPLSR